MLRNAISSVDRRTGDAAETNAVIERNNATHREALEELDALNEAISHARRGARDADMMNLAL